jgi:hypothetical protein
VNDRSQRQQRIAEKIAESQARLDRDNSGQPAKLAPRDAYPPDDYTDLARHYPWLAVAAGLGAGLLVGALLPKRAGSKLGQKALGFAVVAGEMALAAGRQAGEKAEDVGRDGLALAREGGQQLRETGESLARSAVDLLARVRR